MIHTPGPWSVMRGKEIVVVYTTFRGSEDELSSFISLHTAAPDMLETLGIVLSLMDESSGVVGYHMNGEVATWEELGIREEVEAAVRKARVIQKARDDE